MNINKENWLYLDDSRIPMDKKWMVVKDYNEFVTAIDTIGLENFTVISLDHDLGDKSITEYYNNVRPNYQLNYDNLKDEKTGLDCAKYLVAYSIKKGIPLPYVYVHSANPIGAANIMGYINNYLKNCFLKPSCVTVRIEHMLDPNYNISAEERQQRKDNKVKNDTKEQLIDKTESKSKI